MSTDPTLIRDLIAAGVPAGLVERVAEAIAGSRRKQPTILPRDWMPSASDKDAFLELGWRLEDIQAEILHFRDHAASHGRKQADWDAAFRNWMRSPYQHKGPDNDRRSVLKATERLAERTGGDARAYKPGSAGPGSLDSKPGPPGVRLLPKR